MDYIYISSLNSDDTSVQLDADAERHVRALRLRAGEQVTVLNGRGLVAVCSREQRAESREQRAESSEHVLRVVSATTVPMPPTTIVALALLDNKDRMEFAIEKAVELGATVIIPTATQYVQHRRVAIDRWRSKVVSAMTQCGSAWLSELRDIHEFEDVINVARECDVCVVADAHGSQPTSIAPNASVMVFVGPEGGFTAGESEQIRSLNNTQVVRFGNLRLRSETAVVSALTSVLQSRK